MSRQVVLDTETTGLEVEKGHRIIEIACVELQNGRLTERSLHYYVNPECLIDPGAFAVHGISNDFLADKPSFAMIADQLLEFLTGSELIIHNASFDLGFLNAELQRLSPVKPKIESMVTIIDTLGLARQKHPGQANNLDALCKRYQVNNANRNLHGALIDAELLAHVYLRMKGGQIELFTDYQELTPSNPVNNPNTNQIVSQAAAIEIRDLVVRPTAEELKAHQDFLTYIKKEAGKCLW